MKYAGSNDTENLGWPKHRYGLGLNQEVYKGVTVSLAYFHDIYHNHDVDEKDSRDVVFGQIAVEF